MSTAVTFALLFAFFVGPPVLLIVFFRRGLSHQRREREKLRPLAESLSADHGLTLSVSQELHHQGFWQLDGRIADCPLTVWVASQENLLLSIELGLGTFGVAHDSAFRQGGISYEGWSRFSTVGHDWHLSGTLQRPSETSPTLWDWIRRDHLSVFDGALKWNCSPNDLTSWLADAEHELTKIKA